MSTAKKLKRTSLGLAQNKGVTFSRSTIGFGAPNVGRCHAYMNSQLKRISPDK
eukprot:jgi/Botrbrau1/523/Bobra.110_2s0151.1